MPRRRERGRAWWSGGGVTGGNLRRGPATMSDIMTADEVRALDGQTVLVVPSVADAQNSVGKRASVRVEQPTASAAPKDLRVEVVLTVPEMFTQTAHERVIVLTEAEIERLLATVREGKAPELVCDRALDFPGAANATRRAAEGQW